MVYPEIWILAIRDGSAERGGGDLVINPSVAALGIEQHRICRDADTAGHASKCADLVFRCDYQRSRK